MSHAKTASNPNDFILPDLGEGVHEAELIKWRVKVGDVIEEHQILADMETDKALVEVPSPRAGTLAALHGAEGEVLKVGNALVSFVPAAGSTAATVPATTPGNGQSKAPAAVAPAAKSTPAPATKPSPAPAPVSTGPASDTNAQIAANVPANAAPAPAHEDAGTVVGAMGGALGGVSRADGKALATPAVRRLAKEMGVDIDAITGTGMAGRVLDKDVKSAASRPIAKPAAATSAPAAAPAPARSNTPVAHASAPSLDLAAAGAVSAAMPIASGDGQRIPFRGVRRTIANRLKQSITQTVHFTVMDEADVSALDALRKKLASASGEKVSFLPFVAAAVCRALSSSFTELNSTTDDAAEEIIRHRAVHLGIATDTENGLMVPVIRDCDRLGVLQIGRQISAVAEAARNRSATREQLSGSTFTISNVGSHAGRFATPIINYPEVGILAVGRAREGVVVRHGGIAVGKLLPLSLACDHRVVDGASAALMLAKLVEMLQDPEQLLGPAR